MTTITLQLPDDTPLSALHGMAESIDCDLYRLADGTYTARPRHSNATVVPIRSWDRVNNRNLPQPPRGAA